MEIKQELHRDIMDNRLNKLREDLSKKSSSETAAYLLDAYSQASETWWDALAIIPHLSWKRNDQIRLAQHFLCKLPFASAAPYETFLSFMSISTFLRVIKDLLPTRKDQLELLAYYITPALAAYSRMGTDEEAAGAFISHLKERINTAH
ncbi:MAG: hypothetical protein JO142_15000 [Burkholderiales bacterium]|nr:hypothetical protein [Burkholderiales bacterium]